MIFSGSAVIDDRGVAGYGAGAMIALYTGAGRGVGATQVQCLAASTDGGRSFVKHPGNPVLDLGMTDFRDPKLFWHAPTARWIMVVAFSTENRAALFASPDLKSWSLLSHIGPFDTPGELWECPDLIELPIEGGGTGWLFKVDLIRRTDRPGSGTLVVAGVFEGTSFTPEVDGAGRPILGWADWGADFYAAISWANVPAEDGRCLWIGWMNCHDYAAQTPTAPWRGAMTVPRALSLRRIDGALRLVQRPIAELARLRGAAVSAGAQGWRWDRCAFEAELRVNLAVPGFALHLEDGAGGRVVIHHDAERQMLLVDRAGAGGGVLDAHPAFAAPMSAPIDPARGRLDLRLLADSCSLEIFADDGAVVLTLQHFLAEGPCALFVDGAGVEQATGWALSPASLL